MNNQLIHLDAHTLSALLDNPETKALLQELSQDELAKASIDTRHYAEGGKHTVYLDGEPLFSAELWLGRISNVKRLREKRPAPAPEPKLAAKKWEYFIRYGTPDAATLNELGDKGWELVAWSQPRDLDACLYFKREKLGAD